MPKKKAEETESAVETPVTGSAEETAAVEAAPVAEETPKKIKQAQSETGVPADGESAGKKGKRANQSL